VWGVVKVATGLLNVLCSFQDISGWIMRFHGGERNLLAVGTVAVWTLCGKPEMQHVLIMFWTLYVNYPHDPTASTYL
jgi:hypothetical protein